MSALEQELELHIRAAKIAEPVREHRFHPVRRWRFDFAWPDQMFAVEVEGGAFVNGGHNRGAGFERDIEKCSEAMLLGWRVYRTTGRFIKNGTAINHIEKLLAGD